MLDCILWVADENDKLMDFYTMSQINNEFIYPFKIKYVF